MKRPLPLQLRPKASRFYCTVAVAALIGCQSTIINQTDKHVYKAIAERQRCALGATSNVHLGDESGLVSRSDELYSFTPRPATSEIPPEFQGGSRRSQLSPSPDPSGESAGQQPGGNRPPQSEESQRMNGSAAREGSATVGGAGIEGDAGLTDGVAPFPEGPQVGPAGAEPAAPDMMSPDIFTPQQAAQVQTFGLADALRYAQKRGREIQDAKELLYLAALDLTLERHLWTPQFSAAVQAEYVDQWPDVELDRAMNAVAEAAVSQRLPLGGEVTARMVSSLVRDVAEHATTGESGNLILEADIPLFRGAGRVAYESRYQAERDLIYAVRTYERFRRQYLVEVASGYFELQQLRSAIANTFISYKNRRQDWEKADFVNRMGQSRSIFEAPRALSSYRQAEVGLVRAKEAYEAGLDRFKIFIGMPVPEMLDVLDQMSDADAAALDDLWPDVEVAAAVDVALRLRLDLRNTADRVDDARRGVLVARNQILPDLNATGSLALDTEPEHLRSTNFNEDRDTWRALISLRMDDRKRERNAYRAALIGLRQVERDFDVASDTVRADVRRAARRVLQQAKLRAIQEANVEENELRLRAARAQFDLGMITNQDVVDAETDLLSARNELAAAISSYRQSILEFRRDTETLRVTDDGQWVRP
jgi:outer membrane protein TolC